MSINKNVFNELWEITKINLKNKFQNQFFYEKYFLNCNFFKNVNDTVYIIVPSLFVKESLERDHIDKIVSEYSNQLNNQIKIKFILDEEKNIISISNNEKNINSSFEPFDKSKKFNNYVVGEFNKHVYNSAMKIINDDSNNINVFFIHGSTGLGKTHLLNAIAFEYLNKFPSKKVKCLSTEDFLRESYTAISNKGIALEEYKNNFNDIDLLLVDDVQFLSNKVKLNEIFFNIFNNLIKNNKKIIMSSDKHPNEINIDQRMISRFISGITLKIPNPDLESVKQIIIMKLDNNYRKNKFSMAAIELLANKFNNDIRVLEGKINTILFHLNSDNNNSIINEEQIKNILSFNNNDYYIKEQTINPNVLINIVSNAYGISPSLVVSKQRTKEVMIPRKVCMYIMRTKLDMSFKEIGSYFSNRDHSTIMNSINTIAEELENNVNLKEFVENIINKI